MLDFDVVVASECASSLSGMMMVQGYVPASASGMPRARAGPASNMTIDRRSDSESRWHHDETPGLNRNPQ